MAKKKSEVEATEEVVDVENEEVKVPTIDSPGWTEYILSLLEKDELITTLNGQCPTVDGLARIANTVFSSRITVIKTEVVRSELESACVKVTIANDTDCVEAVADVSKHNTDHPFYLYPAATAETRAMGRAYRKLLRLKKVLAAEEMSKQASISMPAPIFSDDSPKISDQQIMFIEVSCGTDRLNISVKEAAEHVCGSVLNSIKQCSYDNALELISKLSSWGNDRTTMPTFNKYDKNWRTTFC